MFKKTKEETVAPEKKTEKAPAKKVEKAPAKKSEEVYIQFSGEEWDVAELKKKAVAAYVAEGHRASSIKKFVLYVKPEERMAYYVVNEKSVGSVPFE